MSFQQERERWLQKITAIGAVGVIGEETSRLDLNSNFFAPPCDVSARTDIWAALMTGFVCATRGRTFADNSGHRRVQRPNACRVPDARSRQRATIHLLRVDSSPSAVARSRRGSPGHSRLMSPITAFLPCSCPIRNVGVRETCAP